MDSATTTTKQTDFRLRLPTLIEYRTEAAKRRAAAFCDVRDDVLGREVMPLTPRTYSMLFAVGSRFLHGGQPIESDVRDYLWFHAPQYVAPAHREWRERKRNALRPLLFQLNQPWRRWIGLAPDIARYINALSVAVAEIQGIIDEAFADAPAVSGTPGAPIATLEAHLIHALSSAYPSWTEEKIRNMPLKKLFQLYRCISVAQGHQIRDHREDAILAAHLRVRNERLQQLQKERAT